MSLSSSFRVASTALTGLCVLAHVSAAQSHGRTHAAAATFEGPVTYEVTPEHGPVKDYTYLVKGAKIRFDIPPNNNNNDADDSARWQPPKAVRRYAQWSGMTQVTDEATGEIFDYITGWNRYYHGHPDTSAAGKAAALSPHIAVAKSGSQETVAGMSCENYTVTDSTKADTTAQICVASGMGIVMGLDGPVSNSTPVNFGYAFAKGHFKNGYLPLKYVIMVKGQPHGQIVATAIQKQTLAPTTFTIPQGWEEIPAEQNNGGYYY